MEYQHKVFQTYATSADEEQAKLNDLGVQGWRLVAVTSDGTYTRLYLVRENP